MSARLSWQRDGQDWPNRQFSRFVHAGGLDWHVQVMGSGPTLLLVHGTGAATHSWRSVAPLLAKRFTVVAPDLPGHGFTDMPPARCLSLRGMAQSLADLLGLLGVDPAACAGHSAGAAILARMILDRQIAPDCLISLNGALLPLRGMPATLFSPAAKLLARLPLVPRMFTLLAGDRAAVERLIRDTGSTIDPEGVALYGRLLRSPGHVAGALAMMANWQLEPLRHDLPRLNTRLLLMAGRNDRTIAPADALHVRDLVAGAEVMLLPGLGHLAHEERPDEIAARMLRHADPPPAT